MYQTRGLFYPSLSQRVYQSNQGLKLAAKAVCHTKGEFICLKSFRLPNDSNIDMKHNRHCFVLFLLSLPPPFSCSPLPLWEKVQLCLVPPLPSCCSRFPNVPVCGWMELSGPGLGCTELTSGLEPTEPARVNSILVSANSSAFVGEYEHC